MESHLDCKTLIHTAGSLLEQMEQENWRVRNRLQWHRLTWKTSVDT